MTTDSKLFALFKVAGERKYASKRDLAREVEQRKLVDFSFEKDGVRVYMNANSIVEYVSFSVNLGLLEEDLTPYIETKEVTWQGFEWSLADKVEDFAATAGFPDQTVREAVKNLISRSPARIPTPRAVHTAIQAKCEYHVFYKAVTVESYQSRLKYQVRSRSTFLMDDIFSDQDVP
jgi:hypothetical protein